MADCFILRLSPSLYSALERLVHQKGTPVRLRQVVLSAEVGTRPDGDSRRKRRDWCVNELKYIFEEAKLLRDEVRKWDESVSGSNWQKTARGRAVTQDLKFLELSVKGLDQAIQALDCCEFPAWESKKE